jgi:hypothetical protein
MTEGRRASAPSGRPQPALDEFCARLRALAAILMVEFSDLRDSFAGLPSRSLGPRPGPVVEGRAARIVIRLTQGNLNNNHVYLRGHLGFFPADAIGAANARDGQGARSRCTSRGFPKQYRPTSQAIRTSSAPAAMPSGLWLGGDSRIVHQPRLCDGFTCWSISLCP